MFVAGPNGSGKSTIAAQGFLDRLFRTPEDPAPVWINPDDILRALAPAHPEKSKDELALMAAQRADQMIEEAIERGVSVIRETVLSTDRLMDSVHRARAKGYRFALLFVLLRDPSFNVARVAARVRQGGHDVPEAKIRRRWLGALAMLPGYAALADILMIYDNSAVADPRTPDFGPIVLVDASPEGVFIAAPAEAMCRPRAPGPDALKRSLRAVLAQLGV